MYFQFSGQDEAALKAQMTGDAEKRVRNNLVLEAIAKAESIEVTDEEVKCGIGENGANLQKNSRRDSCLY